MLPELAIKLDYLESRSDPAEVFEAMALYINAYKGLGQLLTDSIGIRAEFDFKLKDIEKGSIKSRLSALSDCFGASVQKAFFESGNSLFDDLVDSPATDTEEQVDSLGTGLEENLSRALSDQLVEPCVDRKKLAHILNEFSAANEKVRPGETVRLISVADGQEKISPINTRWRFKGDPKKMFMGRTEPHDHVLDKLYVKVAVNEGGAVWTFRSLSTEKSFRARITDLEWLERYQDGLIQAIGPKDILDAELSYDVYHPYKGRGQTKIINAKIKRVKEVIRTFGHQYEL